MAMGKGMCRSAPTAPFSTVGMALQMPATSTMRIASVADRPVVMMELAAVHVERVTMSENQYRMKAWLDQVCISSGTGSWSAACCQRYSGR